ncbi:MAG: DeoR/GlpR transcriptional regulator [Chloroflexi bacterium]|nr:DeoR/GlpR transcriptional regulator [Chloroflexota bacterium]
MANSDLMTLERQEQIVSLVNQLGRVTVAELTERFSVSEATIRRDLAALAESNLIRRAYGGAIQANKVQTSESPIVQRQSLYSAEKERIGAATAELIQDGETLLVVGGSTGLAVVNHLTDHQNLTIITDSLLVANEILHHNKHQVILLGGSIDPNEQAVRGTLARQTLDQLYVDKVILGAKAVSVTRGICCETPEEAEFFRACLKRGNHVILVTDSSKFHLSALVQMTPLRAVHTLVTDKNLSADLVEQVQNLEIDLLLV